MDEVRSSPMPSLADESYINLETFKKDGSGVKTPVWCAPIDGRIAVFSEGKAYKVKRIQREPRCRVAACDVRGNVRGPWVEGTARIVEDEAWIDRVLVALRKKYGIQFRALDFFATLTGRKQRRAYISITLS